MYDRLLSSYFFFFLKDAAPPEFSPLPLPAPLPLGGRRPPPAPPPPPPPEHERGGEGPPPPAPLPPDDRHNRRAAVLNDAVRPLGIFSGGALLAALNPFLLAGSAADSLISTAVNLWHYDRLSAPEREALARYRTLLEREPHTRDAPEIAHAIRRLGTKRAAALCKDTLELAQKALDTDDLDHAAFYAHAADRIDGCADAAARPLARVNQARARRAAREEAGRWPIDDPPQPHSADG